MQITHDMIIGARLVQIHQTYSLKDGLDVREHYFTCDRGFSFCLPLAGHEWLTEDIPSDAELMPHRLTTPSFRVKRGWFGLQWFVRQPDVEDDTVDRLTKPHIAQVLCGPFDEEFGYYESTTILMSDGHRLSCTAVAPHGTGGAGLYYHPPDVRRIERLTDYFTIPIAIRV